MEIFLKIMLSQEYKEISLLAKNIYLILLCEFQESIKNDIKDDRGLYCCFEQSKLAEIFDVTDRTIRRSIKELRNAGLIEVVPVGDKKPAKIYIEN